MKKNIVTIIILFVLYSLPTIANDEIEPTTPENGWTTSQMIKTLAGNDPIEGFNRSMFSVNDFIISYIADPLGRVYTTIIPRPVINAIEGICKNLQFPARAISCLCQTQWGGAGDESLRFLLNTTVGVAGIWDPARYWFDIFSTNADFGQAFASWGIGPGCTFVLPFSSKINVRDTVGMIFDMAFDGGTYIPFFGYATAMNKMVMAHDIYTQTVDGSSDKYQTFKELSILARQLQLKMWVYNNMNYMAKLKKNNIKRADYIEKKVAPKMPKNFVGKCIEMPYYNSVSPINDSLRAVLFHPQKRDDFWYMRLSLFNSDFVEQCKIYSVQLEKDRAKQQFRYWHSKDEKTSDNAPLVIIIPGIGGNHNALMALALGELFYNKNLGVVTLDNPMTWQFAQSNEKSYLPGYTPKDATKMIKYIDEVIKYLNNKLEYKPSKIILLGYSLGGLNTLHIAKLQEENPTLNIDRYIAINPPVDMNYAITKIDDLARENAKLTISEAIEKTENAAGIYMASIVKPMPPFDPEKPNNIDYIPRVDNMQANILASLSFRLGLRGIIFMAHKENAIKGIDTKYSWGSRTELYQEIDSINFRTYCEKFVMPTIKEGITLEEVINQSGLYDIENSLKHNPKIRILHNYDDFLLSEKDKNYLDKVLGKRILWFDSGSHLGNLYIVPVQQEILKAILN